MRLKSIIQLILLLTIFIILGVVYFEYFSKKKFLVEQKDPKLNENISKDFVDNETIKQKDNSKNSYNSRNSSNLNNVENQNNIKNKGKIKGDLSKKITETSKKNKEIPSVVKDVEYLTTDQKGNKYKINARSGRTNKDNINILDLYVVKGTINSKKRSTIYIISDFAEYNSSTLESRFYKNVVINFENKKINSDNFDINMETNIALAYNNVIVTDPKSIMKADIIKLNIETKEIDINPDQNHKSKIIINTKQ